MSAITKAYGWIGLANGTELNLDGAEFTLAVGDNASNWPTLPVAAIIAVLTEQDSEIESLGIDTGEPDDDVVTVIETADGRVHELYTPEQATKFFAPYLAQ